MDLSFLSDFDIKTNYPLAPMSWFKTGGSAEYFFVPKSIEELSNLLKKVSIPVTILGNMSNVLIRDGGIKGLVIKLSSLNQINIKGNIVRVEAGCINRSLCLKLVEENLSGAEFLNSIPGSIGGAVRMNAGANGGEIKDILQSCDMMNFNGEIYSKSKEDLNLQYRSSDVSKEEIVISAELKLKLGNIKKIKATMQEMSDKRNASQPIKEKTGGSTFKNPEGYSAWKLIDEAGLRGYSIGGAKISEKHTNFIINYNNSSSADIENLINLAKEKVLQKSGISLESEIKIIGEK